MSLFSKETLEKAKEAQKAFTVYKEDFYTCSVLDWKVVQVPATDWSSGAPVKTDEMIDNVQFTLSLLKPSEGKDVLDVNDVKAETYTIGYWADPTKTGMTKKGPAKARQFFTAVMGLDVGAPITIDLLEKWLPEIKGKQLKAYISVIKDKEGNSKNRIEKFAKK